MSIFHIIAILLTVTAAFSYLNHRWIKLPTTIGVMLIGLVVSLALIGLHALGFGLDRDVQRFVGSIDFDATLMQGMLSFLLFAGALQINLNELADQKYSIAMLAVAGVLLSAAIFGAGIHFVLGALGLPLNFIYCLLFGALISPTDPVAVLGILKTTKVPKSLEVKIAGESLFNDGIGVVAFIMLSEIALSGRGISVSHIGMLFLHEAIGGAIFGLIVGWIAYLMLKSVDNYQVEVLITLALVSGGYSLASALHTSGPIAIVVAGLLIGNHGRRFAMSERTRHHLDTFWELIDEILNAVLFVLIGMEVLLIAFSRQLLIAGLAAVPVLLFARFVSVGLPVSIMRRRRSFTPGVVKILTWSGLRGGISVAMALSLPPGREREVILTMTYMLVVFSILVQGLTIQPLVTRVLAPKK